MGTNKKYVYATVLSTKEYIPGVIKLYKSLKSTQAKYPFVCVCSISITDNDILKLKAYGIDCLRLTECAVNNVTIYENDNSLSHWKYTYDKLLLFGLTQYDKIVYLDSDMMVMENIDELFLHKSFSAVQAGRLANKDWIRLNSGLMVIEPDVNAKNDMLGLISDVYLSRKQKGLGAGDQDVINEYFPEWPSHKELILPESYNMIFKYIDIYKKNFGFRYSNTKLDKTIKVVHFIGKKKPWNDGFIRKFMMVLKFLIGRSYCLKAYIKYIGY